MAIRSFVGVALLVSAFTFAVGGCGRSWLDDVDTDGGVTDSGGDGAHDSGPDSGPCGPTTCPTGCCSTTGVCIPGSTLDACGIGGEVCVDCGQNGFQICDVQTHQCENNVTDCSAASCPTGCCAGNSCVAGTSISACGDFGAVCQSCAQSGLACQGQQCTSSACGPENCSGCCFGNQCMMGLTQTACGFEGEQCQNCLAMNEQCEGTPEGGGFCEGVVSTCNDISCPGGCCDQFGNCESGISSTACGANAVACQNCLQLGATCDFQVCIVTPPPTCNVTTCPNGCCDGNGFCESGQGTFACGDFGIACQDCASFGETCIGQSCGVSIDSGTCSAFTCPDGCCDVNGFCEPGQNNFACGDFGNFCQNCSTFGTTCVGQQCENITVDSGTCNAFTCPGGCCDVNGFCEAGQDTFSCGDFGNACRNCSTFGLMCVAQDCSFIESGTCGPQTCPGGCCDALGVCEGGSVNTACGSGGNSCVSCSQLGDVCGLGHTCQAPPPPCSAATCPNGCCDASGLCEAGFLDTACGQAGATCANCSASGSTCDTAVSPRVCNSAQMTCPATFTSCPAGLTPPPTFTTTACSENDLQNGAVACASGAHTALCQQFMQFEQMNNSSCGTCLQQFDYDLTEVQGVLACITPFVMDPSCLNTIACLDQCENVSCAMCSSGTSESCESSVENGQCSTWTNEVQCTFPEFEGAGVVCDPNNATNFGSWLEQVGQMDCSTAVLGD